MISFLFYHPHPNPPPSKGEGIIGLAEVIGQAVYPLPKRLLESTIADRKALREGINPSPTDRILLPIQ
jgi:galactose-1-phosphate uridylyltransferase